MPVVPLRNFFLQTFIAKQISLPNGMSQLQVPTLNIHGHFFFRHCALHNFSFNPIRLNRSERIMGATFSPHFWELNQMQYFFKIKAKEQRKLPSSQKWISCAQTCKTLLWYCPGCTHNDFYDFYVTQSFASWIIWTLPFPKFTSPLHDKSFKYGQVKCIFLSPGKIWSKKLLTMISDNTYF